MFTYTSPGRSSSLPLVPLVILLSVIGLVSLSASGVAQENPSQLPRYREIGETLALPVTVVNLFTSGVGYFQHDGTIEGDAEITLTFSTEDVNDLLKSLVLQDFDGGTVEAVTYPSQDPLARILGSFSLNIADNPSLAELMNRARGAQVNVEGELVASGTISGVEYRTRRTETGTEQEAILNLLTADGLRQIPFAGMRSIRFTDGELQRELESALAVIAENRREDRKSITIRFSGTGERRVRIGYVRAVPVWKTSYRVVLGADGTAQLQGWAIVENTGEADWTGVSLGLVSGRPISFVMDLYSPIYTSRPRVQPEFGSTVAPQQYARDVAPAPARSSARESGALAMESVADAEFFASPSRAEPAPIDLGAGVAAAASLESGAVYRVDHPVSIPRRGAALIPIVSRSIPAERLAIYDAMVLSDRALAAVELTNSTELQLPAGPATIFDGANYAGDARLPELIAGEDRLVSYAVDLGSTVLMRRDPTSARTTRVRVVNGVIDITRREALTTEYVIERISDDEMAHIVIHPKRSGWEVTSSVEPTGETSSELRYRVTVGAGESETLTVTEERLLSQQIGLSGIRDDQIVFYLNEETIDADSARALERIRTLRGRLAERERARREIEQEISTIYREQERIRSNLEVLEADTDLYRRFLETLGAQEDRLELLQRRLREAQAEEQTARKALQEYIESL